MKWNEKNYQTKRCKPNLDECNFLAKFNYKIGAPTSLSRSLNGTRSKQILENGVVSFWVLELVSVVTNTQASLYNDLHYSRGHQLNWPHFTIRSSLAR